MRYIRVQLSERQTLFNNSTSSLKRWKSQSDLHQVIKTKTDYKLRSKEYPTMRKISDGYKSIITTNQEIISYPLTYGLFATLDDYYQPISSTIKVKIIFFLIERIIFNKNSSNVEQFQFHVRI
jgi:galactose-1-phosphate uridylyltransferase